MKFVKISRKSNRIFLNIGFVSEEPNVSEWPFHIFARLFFLSFFVSQGFSMGKKAMLILEDGTELEGFSFGADCGATGEVVFNTGMVGYPGVWFKSKVLVNIFVHISPGAGEIFSPSPP